MKIKLFPKMCVFMLALGLAYSGPATGQAEEESPVGLCSTQEWEVLKLVNQERAERGLAPLSVMESLQKANDVRAAELHRNFSHTRPDGSSCFTALEGISYNKAGENIASGYADAAAVMGGWMGSSVHRSNVLEGSFTHIGIGYCCNLDGADNRYWTQLFIGGCRPTSVSVQNGRKTTAYQWGTAIEEMNRMLTVKCRHGMSYIPLTDRMCSGYDKNATGKKKITVSYQGKRATFKVEVTGIDIRPAQIMNVRKKVYNGEPQTQNPRVVLNGRTLVKNKDYTISYKNNRKKGKATMIITGKGMYSGKVRKSFRIAKK